MGNLGVSRSCKSVAKGGLKVIGVRVLLLLAFSSLVDQCVRLEGRPGEPQMVGVNDGRQLLTGGRPLDGLTQQGPGAAGLIIDEFVPFHSKGQFLTVQLWIEDAGSSDLPGIANQ